MLLRRLLGRSRETALCASLLQHTLDNRSVLRGCVFPLLVCDKLRGRLSDVAERTAGRWNIRHLRGTGRYNRGPWDQKIGSDLIRHAGVFRQHKVLRNHDCLCRRPAAIHCAIHDRLLHRVLTRMADGRAGTVLHRGANFAPAAGRPSLCVTVERRESLQRYQQQEKRARLALAENRLPGATRPFA
jgi:hypothetical protein